MDSCVYVTSFYFLPRQNGQNLPFLEEKRKIGQTTERKFGFKVESSIRNYLCLDQQQNMNLENICEDGSNDDFCPTNKEKTCFICKEFGIDIEVAGNEQINIQVVPMPTINI